MINRSSVSMPDANTVAIGARFNDGNSNLVIRIYSGTAAAGHKRSRYRLNSSDYSASRHMPDANTVAIGAMQTTETGAIGHVRIYSWDGRNSHKRNRYRRGIPDIQASQSACPMPIPWLLVLMQTTETGAILSFVSILGRQQLVTKGVDRWRICR